MSKTNPQNDGLHSRGRCEVSNSLMLKDRFSYLVSLCSGHFGILLSECNTSATRGLYYTHTPCYPIVLKIKKCKMQIKSIFKVQIGCVNKENAVTTTFLLLVQLITAYYTQFYSKLLC